MKKYEILEHISELKIRAFGKTKEELFLNMLLGMNKSLKPEVKRRWLLKRKIKISSVDLSALLVDFLSEALYLGQTKRETYINMESIKFSDSSLEAELIGKKIERFGEDIKAVTYYGAEVFQKDGGNWEATVVFDV